MGTSLSGLTPATTFDGLLKTSDNDALDATLKTIGTGDGTDSILQLSNSALQVNGQATIVGLTNNTSASAILAQNSDAYNLLQVRNDGTTIINNGAYAFSQPRFTSTKEIVIHQGLSVGQTAAPTAARAHIKGSGATSATTSLLVQNSAGTELLKVQDDGVLNVSDNIIMGTGKAIFSGDSGHGIYLNGFSSMLFRSNTKDFVWTTQNGTLATLKNDGDLGIGESTPTARLHIKGSGNDNTTTSLLVQNSDADELLKVLDDGVSNVWLASSGLKMQRSSACRLEVKGVGAATNIDISPWSGSMSIGGANVNKVSVGSTTPLDSKFSIKGSGNDATTTALLVQNSDGTDGFWSKDDGSAYVRGNFGIGTPNPGQALSVIGTQIISGRITANGGITASNAQSTFKGSGATSATTALLVQNSAGTDLMKVTDDGNLRIANNAFQIQTSQMVSYRPGIFGGAGRNASAVLQADSTTKGFLPPRMTETERDAISSPAAGLMVYNTTTNKAQCYNGTAWQDLF